MAKPSEVNILIVDDEPDIVEVLSELFSTFGFSVDSAGSGRGAIENLKKKKFQLILTDIRMPDGDGIELLKYAKEKCDPPPTVLLISGFSDYELDELLDIGADGFFHKPYDSSELRRALQRSLAVRSDRWATPVASHPHFTVRKKIGSLTGALTSTEFAVGRGGFFFPLPLTEGLRPNDFVNFQIMVEDQSPISEITGVGKVLWIRQPGGKYPPGIGVEISYLENKIREGYVGWLQKHKLRPYVPLK